MVRSFVRSAFAARCLRGSTWMAVAAVLVAAPATAQSCVLTRLDSPVLHAFDPAFDAAEELAWQFSAG